MPELRVAFEFRGQAFDLSIDEANMLTAAIRSAKDALRVKCSTCRCRIFPGTACVCCAQPDFDPEPFV